MERQWEVNRESSLNYSRVGFVKQISSFLKTVLQQDSAVTYSHPSFSGTERETPLQMEISFISVDVPHKSNFYSVFRVSPVSISEKHNQLTTIFLPESPILEWHIVLPLQSILFLYFWNALKNPQEIKKKKKKNTIEIMWLAGGRPGLWGAVFWLLDPCSLRSVLSSPSLHWGSEPREAAFLGTALAPLSPDFYSVFFLFLFNFLWIFKSISKIQK